MGHRSELLATIVVIIVMLIVFSVKKRLTNKRVIRTIIIIILLAVIIIVMVCLINESSFFSRYTKTFSVIVDNSSRGLSSIFGGENDITSERLELWKIAMEKFSESPVIGIGWFRFAEHVPAAFSAIHGRGVVMNVHNDYLQHLCELGVIGTALVLVPTISFFVFSVRGIKKLRAGKKTEVLMLRMISASVQLFYLVLGLIDPCFYQMTYWIFFIISIILLEFSNEADSIADEQNQNDNGGL